MGAAGTGPGLGTVLGRDGIGLGRRVSIQLGNALRILVAAVHALILADSLPLSGGLPGDRLRKAVSEGGSGIQRLAGAAVGALSGKFSVRFAVGIRPAVAPIVGMILGGGCGGREIDNTRKEGL